MTAQTLYIYTYVMLKTCITNILYNFMWNKNYVCIIFMSGYTSFRLYQLITFHIFWHPSNSHHHTTVLFWCFAAYVGSTLRINKHHNTLSNTVSRQARWFSWLVCLALVFPAGTCLQQWSCRYFKMTMLQSQEMAGCSFGTSYSTLIPCHIMSLVIWE